MEQLTESQSNKSAEQQRFESIMQNVAEVSVKSSKHFIEDSIELIKLANVTEKQLAAFREKYNLPGEYAPLHRVGVDTDGTYLDLGSEEISSTLYVIPVSKFVELAKNPAKHWILQDALELSRNPDVSFQGVCNIQKAVDNEKPKSNRTRRGSLMNCSVHLR